MTTPVTNDATVPTAETAPEGSDTPEVETIAAAEEIAVEEPEDVDLVSAIPLEPFAELRETWASLPAAARARFEARCALTLGDAHAAAELVALLGAGRE